MFWLILLSFIVVGYFGCGWPCNCNPCDPCSDDFNRTASSDVNTGSDCGWTESVGDWEIVDVSGDGILQVTTAGAILLSTTTGADSNMSISVTSASLPGTGAGTRLILAYVDADNYLFAEVVGSGTPDEMRLYQRASGTDTLLRKSRVALPVGSFGFSACYSNGTFTARVSAASISTQTINVVGLSETSGTVGIGTNATAGTYRWTLASIGLTTGDCPNCGENNCSVCTSQTHPSEVQVDTAAIANGCGSGDCTNLEGTFVLLNDGADPCTYRYWGALTSCAGANNYTFTVVFSQFGANFRVAVAFNSGAGNLLFRNTSGTPPIDCSAFSATSVAFIANTTPCGDSSSTCTITSL